MIDSLFESTDRCRVLELDYTANACTMFGALVDKPGAVLLDSCSGNGAGRFDVMSAWPDELFEHHASQDAGAFLKQVRDAASLVEAVPLDQALDIPFIGGAIGFLPYDFGCPGASRSDKCGIPLLQARVGIYRWALVTDHLVKKTYLVLHPSCTERVRSLLAQALQFQSRVKEDFRLLAPFQMGIERERYQNDLARIHQYILAGDCYQVNYTVRFESAYLGSSWHAYQIVRRACPTPFSAFIPLNSGAISSHSPERFISVRGKFVEARPIKGTARRGATSEEDYQKAQELAACAKNRSENVMIVDLLRNDLGRVCLPGTIRVPELCKVETYPNVHHLVSSITGELPDGKDAWDVLETCFPGGSITGAPKKRSMEIIEELEEHNRSIYCGSVFYIDCLGRSDSSITIRTLLFSQEQVFVWGGGGIVHESIWEEEFGEIHNKVGVIIRALEASL